MDLRTSIPHGDGVSISVTGLDAVQAALRQHLADAERKLGGALYREGEGILTDAVTKFPRIPVDEGILQESKFVEPPVREGNEVVVRAGVGGAAEAYAFKQHEDPTLHHDGEDEGAFYLSAHLNERSSTMDARIAADLA